MTKELRLSVFSLAKRPGLCGSVFTFSERKDREPTVPLSDFADANRMHTCYLCAFEATDFYIFKRASQGRTSREKTLCVYFASVFSAIVVQQLPKRPGLYVRAIVVQQLPVFLLASLRSAKETDCCTTVCLYVRRT